METDGNGPAMPGFISWVLYRAVRSSTVVFTGCGGGAGGVLHIINFPGFLENKKPQIRSTQRNTGCQICVFYFEVIQP